MTIMMRNHPSSASSGGENGPPRKRACLEEDRPDASPPSTPTFPIRELPVDTLGAISIYLSLGDRDLAALCLVCGRQVAAEIKRRHLKNNAGAIAFLIRMNRLHEWTAVNTDWRRMTKPYYDNDALDLHHPRPVQFDMEFNIETALEIAADFNFDLKENFMETFFMREGGASGSGRLGMLCIKYGTYYKESKRITTCCLDVPIYVAVLAVDGRDVSGLSFEEIKDILKSDCGCSKTLRVADSLFVQRFMNPSDAVKNGRLDILKYYVEEAKMDVNNGLVCPLGSSYEEGRGQAVHLLYAATRSRRKGPFRYLLSCSDMLPDGPITSKAEPNRFDNGHVHTTTALKMLVKDKGICESNERVDRINLLISHPRFGKGTIDDRHGGCTALHIAAVNYDEEVVRILLAAGANPFVVGEQCNLTPLESVRKQNTFSEDGHESMFAMIELLEEAERSFSLEVMV